MASQVFNEFKRASAAAEVDLRVLGTGGDDIRVSLHMTNTTIDTENSGIVTNNDFTTSDEFDGSGYSAPGKALTNENVVKDDPNNRAEFDADDLTWTSLGAGTRSIAGALVYKFETDWASSLPICWVEFSATPDGNDFTIQWNAEGIMQLT